MGPQTAVNQNPQSLTEADERYDRHLAAARASFPDREIIETHGGLIAVPSGTDIVSAQSLDSLVRKLRAEPVTEPWSVLGAVRDPKDD